MPEIVFLVFGFIGCFIFALCFWARSVQLLPIFCFIIFAQIVKTPEPTVAILQIGVQKLPSAQPVHELATCAPVVKT